MRHLVIGQCQTAPNFSAFRWSPHDCLITIGQHFVTTRVVHLSKRTETSLITESDQSRANHLLLQLCTVRTAWSDLDQAVRAVHSCKSWLLIQMLRFFNTVAQRVSAPFEHIFAQLIQIVQLRSYSGKTCDIVLNWYKTGLPKVLQIFKSVLCNSTIK